MDDCDVQTGWSYETHNTLNNCGQSIYSVPKEISILGTTIIRTKNNINYTN